LFFILAEPDIITENTQFVEINGHKLRIVHIIHELGSKVPLIVFIHGLGGQVKLNNVDILKKRLKFFFVYFIYKVSQWKCQIEYFSRTAHILAIDLLGCGKSEVAKE
jgi:pimeloyl-ACP methyl ester carboxylesterase